VGFRSRKKTDLVSVPAPCAAQGIYLSYDRPRWKSGHKLADRARPGKRKPYVVKVAQVSSENRGGESLKWVNGGTVGLFVEADRYTLKVGAYTALPAELYHLMRCTTA